MTAPSILDIVQGSITDGPGVRTTVHFEGCPLCCVWCRHPGSHRASSAGPLPMEREGSSVEESAASREIWAGGAAAVAPCDRRVGSLPAARGPARQWPIQLLVAALLEESDLHQATGGGVTLAVGDPTLHAGYLASLLRALKSEGTHLVLQTCGMFDFAVLRRELLPFLDLVYFDLKFIDSGLHRIYTGQGNDAILGNFRLLAAELGDRLIARVPMIPGITMTEHNVAGIAAFLREAGASSSMLVPYVPGGFRSVESGP